MGIAVYDNGWITESRGVKWYPPLSLTTHFDPLNGEYLSLPINSPSLLTLGGHGISLPPPIWAPPSPSFSEVKFLLLKVSISLFYPLESVWKKLSAALSTRVRARGPPLVPREEAAKGNLQQGFRHSMMLELQ